jgi:outer membrane protein
MKKYVTMSILTGLLIAAPASAQNFFGRFLDRFQEPQVDAPILQTTDALPVSLTALTQADGLPLRVSDVIQLALESNLSIGVNRFNPLISQYAIDTAYQQFDPTMTFSGTVNRSTAASATQIDGADVNRRLTGTYQISYNHNLDYGSNYSVSFRMNRSSTNSSFSTINPSYNGTLTYGFTQPLLRGFGRDINTSQITIARNNLEQSEIQFEQQVMALVVQATNAYWDLVAAHEDIRVQEGALERAQRTYMDNVRQVEIGTLAPIEVVQAEQAVASQREGLIVSQASLVQLEDTIKTMITRVPDPALVLLRLDPIDDIRDRTNEILPIEGAIRQALLNRPEMRQAELAIRNSEINLKVSKNNLLPQLDLTAQYSQSGIGGSRNVISGGGFGGGQQVVTVIPGGIGGAFSDIFGFDFTGYQVGFSLQIPLGNRAARATVAQRTIQQRQTISQEALLRQQIATEVRDAYNQIATSQARIEAAEVSRELAERRLDAEERKFQLGASSIRFVLDEQQNLTSAQTTEIRALVAYVKAVVAYDNAIGRTLERNNIEIEERNQPSIARVGTFQD